MNKCYQEASINFQVVSNSFLVFNLKALKMAQSEKPNFPKSNSESFKQIACIQVR